MTAADRSIIVEQCRQAAEPRILITHGTDTMIDTAAVLASALGPSSGKTVVLTGAMIPYAFGSSDGLFNLGSALSFVQVLPHGVYVAMNGRHFAWDRVRKNREVGVFEFDDREDTEEPDLKNGATKPTERTENTY
jgi:L-asparaginase